MRVALIADIHGNLIALDAVLADLGRERIDQIVCLGDVAAGSPQPRETIERLQALGCPAVMGNADAWMLNPQPRQEADDDWRRIEEINYWCLAQLAPPDLEYLRTFQPTVEIPLDAGASLLGFHGSPRSYDDIIVATTAEPDLEEMIAGRRAVVLAGGHAHTQLLRRYRDRLIVNPGSVGLPFERLAPGGHARNPPWAEYAILAWESGRLGIDLRRVPIELDALRRAALASGMPHAEWWIKDWLA